MSQALNLGGVIKVSSVVVPWQAATADKAREHERGESAGPGLTEEERGEQSKPRNQIRGLGTKSEAHKFKTGGAQCAF